jgi:membrane protein
MSEIGALVGRALRVFVRIAGVDRAMALASQIFVAAIPAAAIICTLAPGDGDFGDRLVARLSLSGDAAHVVRQLFGSDSTGGEGLGAFGAVLLLLSILSLARTVQRIYSAAWDLSPRRVPDTKATLRWLPGLLVFGLGSWGLSELGSVDAIAPLAVLLAVAWSLLFWIFTPLTLLDRRISRRALLPGAAFTTVALLAAGVWAEIVIPGEIERYVGRYGLIGVAIAIVSYCLALAFVIVAGAVFGAALAGHGATDSSAAFSRSYSASSSTPRV